MRVEDSMEALKTVPDMAEQVNKYEITLETIDQAILELGPFAKDIDHQERLESIPLEWTPAEFAAKKERRRSSPAQTPRNLRVSTDEPSPLVLVGSPGRDQQPKSRRGGGRKKPLIKDSSVDSPLLNGDTAPANTAAVDLPNTSVSQETSVAEAMLALSHVTTTPLVPADHHPPSEEGQKSQSRPLTVAEVTPHPPTAKGEERMQKPPLYHQHQPTIWKTAPPHMPTLSRIPPNDGVPHKRRTSSSSSHYSAVSHVIDDSRHQNYSPSPVPAPKVSSNSAHPQYVVESKGSKMSPHTEDDKTSNPFWPVPPTPTRQQEVPSTITTYPLVSLQSGWNPAATYRPYVPLASFPHESQQMESMPQVRFSRWLRPTTCTSSLKDSHSSLD